MYITKDITGKEFGLLTAISRTEERSRYGVIWLVKCTCGKELKKTVSDLYKKPKREIQAPKSCGCYYKNHRSPKYKGVGDLSKSKWLVMQSSAKRRGLEFTITIEEAWNLFVKQKKRCALSGTKITLNPSTMIAGASTASLDRIDNNKGYIPGNIQWVHVIINDMKSNFLQSEFIDWCRRIAHHTTMRGL